MQRTVWFLGVILLVTSVAACSSKDSGSNKCSTDAATQACMCSDGKSGVLACGAGASSPTCDCSAAGGTNNAGSSGGGGGASGSTAIADGGANTGNAGKSGNMSDDDGGSASDASSDAASNGGNGKDSGSSAAATYSGPCNNDKGCPGDETCVHSGMVSFCAGSCMVDKDCPKPDDGMATPTCSGANPLLGQPGYCALYCGGLLAGDCPHGMECSALLLLSGECAWKGTI
jgi:hypothetical protein